MDLFQRFTSMFRNGAEILKEGAQENAENIDLQSFDGSCGSNDSCHGVVSDARDSGDQIDEELKSDLHVNMKKFHDRIDILEISNVEDADNTDLSYQIWFTEVSTREMKPFRKMEYSYIATELKPNQEYEVFIVELLDGFERSITKCSIITSISGPPSDFEVKGEFSRGKYYLSWNEPLKPWGQGVQLTGYTVEVYDSDNSAMVTKKCYRSNVHQATFNLEDNRRYYFKIYAKSDERRGSVTYGEQHLKHTLLKKCIPRHTGDGNMFYLLDMTEIKNDRDLVKIKEYGRSPLGGIEETEKVILLVGATGAGKTTWLNAYVNYLFDVKLGDPFRFKLIEDDNEKDQTVSKTQYVTIYRLHHQKGMAVDYSITIVDTPGFGDTRGVSGDKKIEEEIHRLFRDRNGYLEHINAVAFVTPASTARLTPTQKYIFDSILSLFGKNIEGNIILLVTNAYTKDTKALRAVKKHGIKIKESFYFENANILGVSEYRVSASAKNEGIWKNTAKYFKKFCAILQNIESKSASQTQEVLDKRARLQLHTSSMRKYLEDGLILIGQFREEQRLLRIMGQGNRLPENQTITTKIVKYEVTSDGEDRVNAVCVRCEYTCHEKCHCIDDSGLENCIAMDKTNGLATCKICPNKCPSDKHRILHSKYQRKVVEQEAKLKEIKDRYEKSSGKVLTPLEVSEQLLLDLESISCRVKASLSEITDALTRLKSIALLNWPMSQIDYIEQLIATETLEGQQGCDGRIELLDMFLKEAKYLQSIDCNDFDPFRPYRLAAEEAITNGDDASTSTFWRKITKRFDKRTSKTKREFKIWIIFVQINCWNNDIYIGQGTYRCKLII